MNSGQNGSPGREMLWASRGLEWKKLIVALLHSLPPASCSFIWFRGLCQIFPLPECYADVFSVLSDPKQKAEHAGSRYEHLSVSEASVNNVLTEFPAAQAFDSSASYIPLCLLFSYEKAHIIDGLMNY